MVSRGASRRIYQLDAVRGLLAIGVMAYHVVHPPEAFGTWGVYAFFVLSGWALEHVYGAGRLELRSFAVARIARLAPLWIPVVLLSAWLYGIADPARIALNVTGLFGLVLPGATSIATGGWSIGIEAVCYLAFPLLTRLRTRELVVITAAATVLRTAWVGGLMPADLTGEWIHYTQLPSFLVFFVAGVLAARTIRLGQWSGRHAAIATWLGDASYGTYLLHPLVAVVAGPTTLVVTPLLAVAVRRWYEIPVGRWIRLRAGGRSSALVSEAPVPDAAVDEKHVRGLGELGRQA